MSAPERVIKEIKLLPEFSDEQLAAWREEFDAEDYELAEMGLADYAAGLAREDVL